MSTHASITLILRDETKAQRILKSTLCDSDGIPYEIDLTEKDRLSIYCHFDGYPSGVGKTLLESYQDYDSVLKLVCCGNLSYLDKFDVLIENDAFYTQREDWDRNQPRGKERNEEYNYVFGLDNRWHMDGIAIAL